MRFIEVNRIHITTLSDGKQLADRCEDTHCPMVHEWGVYERLPMAGVFVAKWLGFDCSTPDEAQQIATLIRSGADIRIIQQQQEKRCTCETGNVTVRAALNCPKHGVEGN